MADPDTLHRHIKLALDTGEAESLDAATRLFASYRLAIAVGPDVATSATLQATVLTAVNAARRSFLGGVKVAGDLDVPLRVPVGRCQTLGEAVGALHGRVVQRVDDELPCIVVGEGQPGVTARAFAVRTTFEGWSGGVVPLDDGRRLPEQLECTPAGVLAAGLAVGEAFQFVRGDNAAAGHRAVGMSLWNPDPTMCWLTTADPGPALEWLPSKLWVIGLGHLGQAYLWTLGLLPYAAPDEVELVLHDFDTLTPANESTSLLTTGQLVGLKKTRAVAGWCEERGFRTTILERRFANNFQVAPDEPRVALCGVDNALARAALENVGFERVIEAGLGAGTREYLAFQVHTFPASRSARARWGSGDLVPATAALLDYPAYRALAGAGVDECGLTSLAGRTVGASFVGATTATIVVAESLRMAIGAQQCEVIDGSLRSLEHRQVVASAAGGVFNPGVTRAR